MNATLDAPGSLAFEELRESLGGIPAHRILLDPAPGTATEADVIRLLDHHDRLCELIDGTLVEKDMRMKESVAGLEIGHKIKSYLDDHDIGFAAGADGTIKVRPDQVRIPDVAFYSYGVFQGRKVKLEAMPLLSPTLSVEVLSENNTRGEMEQKRRELFAAGTKLVWEIDADERTVEIFTGPDESTTIGENDALDGGDVLPGFTLPLKEFFDKVDRTVARFAG